MSLPFPSRRETLAAADRDWLLRVLELARGNVSEAARLSGIERSNFNRLLRKRGITAQKRKEAA